MSDPRGLLTVFSDGASRGNPGPAGIGGRAVNGEGEVVAEVCEYLGETTNNVAEYLALITILESVAPLGFQKVRVLTDSVLVAEQVKGGFKVKSPALKPLAGRVRSLLESYREVEVTHVPREKNTECDLLANRAVDEGLAGLREPLIEQVKDSRLF
jgi:ribonuclease HI